jgi:hypothetical protein
MMPSHDILTLWALLYLFQVWLYWIYVRFGFIGSMSGLVGSMSGLVGSLSGLALLDLCQVWLLVFEYLCDLCFSLLAAHINR